MATSIPISGLNTLSVITSSDFIPIVQSSSMTTYRVPIEVFGDWMSSEVTVTSSLTSISASHSDNSDNAISSSYSLVTDNLNYPNTSTASYAISASYSHRTTSSSYSLFATSASYARIASTASYLPASAFPTSILNATSASWASRSMWSTSSSFSDRTISASYALSASYSVTAGTSLTASYILGGSTGPKFFDTAINVDSDNGVKTATSYNAVTLAGVPAGSTAVILDANFYTLIVSPQGFIQIRKNPSTPSWLNLISWFTLGAVGLFGGAGQGTFPLETDGTFEYRVTQPTPGGQWHLRIIGYY